MTSPRLRIDGTPLLYGLQDRSDQGLWPDIFRNGMGIDLQKRTLLAKISTGGAGRGFRGIRVFPEAMVGCRLKVLCMGVWGR